MRDTGWSPITVINKDILYMFGQYSTFPHKTRHIVGFFFVFDIVKDITTFTLLPPVEEGD